MGNPELSHQVGQAAYNAKEAVSVLLDSNLFQSLQDIGHPYGLLLGSPPPPDWFLSFFPDWVEKDFVVKKKKKGIEFDKGATPLSLLISASPWFILSGKSLKPFAGSKAAVSYKIMPDECYSVEKLDKLIEDEGEKLISSWLIISTAGVGVGKNANPNFLNDFSMDLGRKLFKIPSPLASAFMKLLTMENRPKERQREFHIGRSRVSLGTSSIHLKNYKGEEPFIIKTPQGEPVAQINPGDPLGSMHVSQQASLLRKLSPLEKIQAVTGDILSLFTTIDQPEQPGLSSKQQETLNRARSATIIGISHLTRLLRRKTGLSTWNLDVLPEAVQNLHRLDSQAVSDRFGGGRKVKPEDIEMLVITPEQRQMLVATA